MESLMQAWTPERSEGGLAYWQAGWVLPKLKLCCN